MIPTDSNESKLRTFQSIFQDEISCLWKYDLTHWGQVTHICVSKLTIIGSDNGLLPGRHQAIIWTNAGILLIEPLGTNFNEILIEIHTFSFTKMHLKMSSGKCRPSCLSLNVLSPSWFQKSINQRNVSVLEDHSQKAGIWPRSCVLAKSHKQFLSNDNSPA